MSQIQAKPTTCVPRVDAMRSHTTRKRAEMSRVCAALLRAKPGGQAAGASVETLNPTCEVGDMGKKTLLEFTTMMVEEFLPQMEGDPDAPPDFADKAKAILVFLKAELE